MYFPQAWLALVPNPPDGGPSLLWGYIVMMTNPASLLTWVFLFLQAWLALVPNPPDGGPSLLWGYIVTTGDRPEPMHRQQKPPRSAVKKVRCTAHAYYIVPYMHSAPWHSLTAQASAAGASLQLLSRS